MIWALPKHLKTIHEGLGKVRIDQRQIDLATKHNGNCYVEIDETTGFREGGRQFICALVIPN